MRHSPAHVVKYVLTGAGLTWPVYVSSEPDEPDQCVTIYDTAGRDFGRSGVDMERWEHSGLQVRVRAKDHPSGYAKAREIALMLDAVYNVTVTVPSSPSLGSQDYIVHSIRRMGDVIPLGADTPTSKRRLFTINALSPMRQAAPPHAPVMAFVSLAMPQTVTAVRKLAFVS